MPTYIEYELDDQHTIMVEVVEDEDIGLVQASRDRDGNVVVKASVRFGEALDAIKSQAKVLMEKLDDLAADEVEVTFGITTTGEVGNFAIGKLGMEANYQVKLTWKDDPQAGDKKAQ